MSDPRYWIATHEPGFFTPKHVLDLPDAEHIHVTRHPAGVGRAAAAAGGRGRHPTRTNQGATMTTSSIIVNGVEYVPAPTPIDPNYVIIRSRDAGVFAGDLETTDLATASVVLRDARRLWYWDGAATLSQLALDGVSKPTNCKFPAAVPSITVLGVCEIIPATEECRQSIAKVAPWRA